MAEFAPNAGARQLGRVDPRRGSMQLRAGVCRVATSSTSRPSFFSDIFFIARKGHNKQVPCAPSFSVLFLPSPDHLHPPASRPANYVLHQAGRSWPLTKLATRQDDHDTTNHLPWARGRRHGRGRRAFNSPQLSPTTPMAQVMATTEEGGQPYSTSAGHDILLTRNLQEHTISSEPNFQCDTDDEEPLRRWRDKVYKNLHLQNTKARGRSPGTNG